MRIDVIGTGFVELVDSMGNDESVVRSARVSYANDLGVRNLEADNKLINYLMRNHHNTPFESVEVQIHTKIPIAILRQWHRHRTQSYNEMSGRYCVMLDECYIPEAGTVGKPSPSSKQARVVSGEPLDTEFTGASIMQATYEFAYDSYCELLDLGYPKEVARFVLPQGLYTRQYAKANLHNWFKFLAERLHPHAQYEIQQYAKAVLGILRTIAPSSVAAFEEHMLS